MGAMQILITYIRIHSPPAGVFMSKMDAHEAGDNYIATRSQACGYARTHTPCLPP